MVFKVAASSGATHAISGRYCIGLRSDIFLGRLHGRRRMLEFRTIVCDGTLSRSGARASLVGKDGTVAAHLMRRSSAPRHLGPVVLGRRLVDHAIKRRMRQVDRAEPAGSPGDQVVRLSSRSR